VKNMCRKTEKEHTNLTTTKKQQKKTDEFRKTRGAGSELL